MRWSVVCVVEVLFVLACGDVGGFARGDIIFDAESDFSPRQPFTGWWCFFGSSGISGESSQETARLAEGAGS